MALEPLSIALLDFCAQPFHRDALRVGIIIGSSTLLTHKNLRNKDALSFFSALRITLVNS